MVKHRYSAEYLTAILNALRDLVFIFDDEGIILDCLQDENQEWLYVPKQQFVGRHHQDVLPRHLSEKIEVAITEVRKGKDTFSFDYNLSIKESIVWFSAVFSAIRADDGAAANYVCVIREITQRKEKELLLQSVLDNAFNAFVVLRAVKDSEERVVDFEWLTINYPAEKMIGHTSAQLQKKRISDTPDQPWILFEGYRRVAETGKTLDVEHSYSRDHHKIWLHTHASKIQNDLVVTVKDITEKKQAEINLQNAVEELRVSRQHLELFFTQSLSGLFLMMLDEPLQWDETIDKESALDYAIDHLHFTRVNDALLEQYGATPDKFIGLTLKDFFKGDISRARESLRDLYNKGRIHINRKSKKLDGSDLWLEGHYICITSDANRILGHFGIQQDTTERKRAEDALRASEASYRLLATNMLDMVALHEPDGTFKYVSPSVKKLLGYSPEELLGTNPYSLFHPDDIRTIREQSHNQAVEGEEITNIEYRIQKKDGQFIWFSTSTKPIKDSNGNVTMLQTVSREVTEKVETLHILEELNHQKNKLFSIIAHDLRGPLASCMGLLNLTQRAASPDDLEKYLRMARKSAFNLHELMEDLLLWAGSQLDKVSFNPSILNIKDEIEVVTWRFTEIAQAKNITLNVSVENDAISVFADRDMIRTVIRNLLSNAIKFSHPSGQVEIIVRTDNGCVEICVADSGTGIKKDDLAKLFSKTSTFTTYGTAGEKGTGLGLDICQDLVEKHKGKIRVESEYGAGSRFIFTLKEF